MDILFSVRSALRGFDGKVAFDLKGTQFIGPAAVALLGAVCRSVIRRGGSVDFDWSTAQPAVRRHLSTNGFRQAFDHHSTSIGAHSIPYREFPKQEPRKIVEYLEREWLERGWVTIDDEQRADVLGAMWEIFANAFEHSGSSLGVFACGHHQALRQQLQLSVVDLGFGIVENVRQHLTNDDMPAEEAIRWAFARGHTTSRKGIGRGLGLQILHDLVRLKKGKLEIYSNDGCALADEDGVNFRSRRGAGLRGTLVNVTLTCDNSKESRT